MHPTGEAPVAATDGSRRKLREPRPRSAHHLLRDIVLELTEISVLTLHLLAVDVATIGPFYHKKNKLNKN